MTTWWGSFEVPIGESRNWRIGPTSVWIRRLDHEWQIASETGDDPMESLVEIAAPLTGEGDPFARADLQRFGTSSTHTTIHLTPSTCDRALVTRPITPFTVPGREQVTVFVSSPLWLRIEAGETRRLLRELPLYRPADTWFGPSPREGELCYASQAAFRVQLAEMPVRPHRAITALRIDNQGDTPLALERVKVPLPLLPLYADSDGGVWTPDVTFERVQADDLTPLKIAKQPPKHAATSMRIAPAREVGGTNLLRAFSSLFASSS